MSAEAVTKKRGRPKKTDKTTAAAHEQLEATTVTTSKQSTKSRTLTTTKALSTNAASKKPSRRKKLVDVDEIDDSDGNIIEQVKTPVRAKSAQSTIKAQPSGSAILDEAKAFTELKHSAAIKKQASTSSGVQQQSPSHGDSPPGNPVHPADALHESQSTRSISIPEEKPSSKSTSSSRASDSIEENSSRSSFLSGFLSDTPDAVPEAPESAKISDRSAFKSQSFSIDDIVSGAGVSDLASLAVAIEEKAAVKPPRQSAIPMTAPKAFKSHSLSAFPDKPEQQKSKPPPAQKYVNPETYNLSSFQRFKAHTPTATAASLSTTTPLSSTTETKPAFQPPYIPPTTNMAEPLSQTQTQPPPQQATLKTTSSPISSSSPFQSQPQSQPQRPLPPNPTIHPTRPSLITPATKEIPAHLRPKRPTEMTPSELLKNAEFKSLRRKWTGVIVGIPVLVVTSYLLWDRLDKEEKARGWVSGSGPVEEGMGRKRGELPRRILEDGGLERK